MTQVVVVASDHKRITADLIRVSSGIEGTQDLIGDFAQALEKASA